MDINVLDFIVWLVMNIIFMVISKQQNDGNYVIGCLFFILNIIYIMVFVYPIDLDWVDIIGKIKINW